jgi:hypothetical protein
MSKGFGKTIGRRIRIRQSDDASASCSGSSRLDPPSALPQHALLTISEIVCARVGLPRYSVGNQTPQRKLSRSLLTSGAALRASVRFTTADLAALGVSPLDLAPIIFDPASRQALATEMFGHTRLERKPILAGEDGFYLVLPTAVSAAARRFVIEWLRQAQSEQEFESALAVDYARLIHETPLLGGEFRAPVDWGRFDGVRIASFGWKADEGRYIAFILFTDSFKDADAEGLIGRNPEGDALTRHLRRHMTR